MNVQNQNRYPNQNFREKKEKGGGKRERRKLKTNVNYEGWRKRGGGAIKIKEIESGLSVCLKESGTVCVGDVKRERNKAVFEMIDGIKGSLNVHFVCMKSMNQHSPTLGPNKRDEFFLATTLQFKLAAPPPSTFFFFF